MHNLGLPSFFLSTTTLAATGEFKTSQSHLGHWIVGLEIENLSSSESITIAHIQALALYWKAELISSGVKEDKNIEEPYGIPSILPRRKVTVFFRVSLRDVAASKVEGMESNILVTSENESGKDGVNVAIVEKKEVMYEFLYRELIVGESKAAGQVHHVTKSHIASTASFSIYVDHGGNEGGDDGKKRMEEITKKHNESLQRHTLHFMVLENTLE